MERDYWIVIDKENKVVGTAEVKRGSLSSEDVLTPYADNPGCKAVKAPKELLDYYKKHHGEEWNTQLNS